MKCCDDGGLYKFYINELETNFDFSKVILSHEIKDKNTEISINYINKLEAYHIYYLRNNKYLPKTVLPKKQVYDNWREKMIRYIYDYCVSEKIINESISFLMFHEKVIVMKDEIRNCYPNIMIAF
jgi:hypothetical protein